MLQSANMEHDLEAKVFQFGSEIFNDVRGSKVSVFDPEFYTGKLIEWAMQDDGFRTSLFRFVDVLPSLEDSAQVMHHVNEYFSPVADRIPGLLKWGLNMNPNSLQAKATAALVKKQIKTMAGRFILGATPDDALKSIRGIRKQGMAFTIDLLGEATVSEKESDEYLERYLELIRVLHREVPSWKESQALVEGHPGESTPLNISVKLSALYSQAKGVNFDKSVDALSYRLRKIVEAAMECGCFVYVDMESTLYTDLTLETVKRVMGTGDFRDYDRFGIVLQAYLRRTEKDTAAFIEWLKERGTPMAVRLVKGAYWDTETILAKQSGWPIPVWQEKSASDVAFEKVAKLLLDNTDHVMPAFGSHNIRSLCYAIKYAESLDLDLKAYELQSLFGMAEPIKKAFVDRGYLMREYAPVGELIPGMAYLVRRLLENTSNKGFIRQGFHEDESAEKLLIKPTIKRPDTGTEYMKTNPRESFSNSPLWDFCFESYRTYLGDAVQSLSATLRDNPAIVEPIIAGKPCDTEKEHEVRSPEDQQFVLARIQMASVDQAEEALNSLTAFFPEWRDTPIEDRAEILYKTAAILEERRADLSATMVLESGKPWAEADADIAEAIDFLNYYALHATRLFKKRVLTHLDGQDNILFYEPRGVCLTIGPWNFPSAIPCGMLAAALVTGNTAIMKPAEQSSLIAYKVFQAFLDAGLPPKAAAFLPGYGEEIGKHLVDSPRVETIVFTGSKEVGLNIVETAAKTQKGQRHVKRVIAEMGGKNAIIIDDDADLDQAVKGVLHSAFGFSGQKCSACSRVIVHETAYPRFIERLEEGVKSLTVGPASEPASTVGPVIEPAARERLLSAIDRAKQSAKLLAQAPVSEDLMKTGLFVPPTVFVDVTRDNELMTQELFGPVVAVVKAKDFDDALSVALDTEYALTGGVFSRSPKNLKKAAESFRVGNLYLNQPCTGALVKRHPFGGFGMSGVGSKTGGPDYLLQFVIPRALSENTMRQGFAPMEDN